MKATKLEQVLNNFSANQPLTNDRLKAWFVERGSPIRKQIALDLKRRHISDPAKILLIGHRGSGKSTELNQLALEIRDQFFVVSFDAYETIGRSNLTYEDLMLTIFSRVIQACVKEGVLPKPLLEQMNQGLIQPVVSWWKQFIAGSNVNVSAELSATVQLETIVGQVEAVLKHSSDTRETFKQRVSQQLPELLRQLDSLVHIIQEKTEKKLLIVVEGTDKIDQEAAINLFSLHTATLTAPKVNMIYTCPMPLRFTEYFQPMGGFSKRHVFPNISTQHKNGDPKDDGIKVLHDLVLERMEAHLIAQEAGADALGWLVQHSGGIPKDLVLLVEAAALNALSVGNSKRIELSDAKLAVTDYARDVIMPSLTSTDIAVLWKRHRDKRLTADKENQRLLFAGSLIEFRNDEAWCDAHPALWEWLESLPEPEDDKKGGDKES